MTVDELANRVAALEAEVRQLRAAQAAADARPKSVLDLFGKYADDPAFEEAVRLGREYREQVNRESLEEFDREEAAATPRKPVRKAAPKRRTTDAGA